MKDKIIRVFTEEEVGFVKTLTALGMRRVTANALTYLFLLGDGTSVDIETATGLRQPEVSTGLTELKPWVGASRVPKSKKYVYSLEAPITDVIASYYDKLLTERDAQDAAVDRIRKMVD